MKKRQSPPFDKRFFTEKKSTSTTADSVEQRFIEIYTENFWGSQSSVSGLGSNNIQTKEIRKNLPKVISRYKIQSILDIPCGDFNWMSTVDLKGVAYYGADIVQEIVTNNSKEYTNGNRKFSKLDLINDMLPKVDLIFCRDCLVHLSNDHVLQAIENIKKSNSKYLLSTTFTKCDRNDDIVTGDWRIINLNKQPFNFSDPILLINENCTEGNNTYTDKSLGLWKISDL